MKKLILITVLLVVIIGIAAKGAGELDSMLGAPSTKNRSGLAADSLRNDIIRFNYEKKSAHRAMLYSMILPGAGQYYAERSSLQKFIFPIIEAAVIGGIIYYHKQGTKKTEAYERYAKENVDLLINGINYHGPRYNRQFQFAVQDTMSKIHPYDIYDSQFFRLDNTNTQHFFEDIGKYNKYIFGWVDWYYSFAEMSPNLNSLHPTPIWVWDSTASNPEHRWIGNKPLNNPSGATEAPNSALRNKYIELRQQAEDQYLISSYFTFGIALNHIVSAINAYNLTKRLNRLYLSKSPLDFDYYAVVHNGQLTPILAMKVSF